MGRRGISLSAYLAVSCPSCKTIFGRNLDSTSLQHAAYFDVPDPSPPRCARILESWTFRRGSELPLVRNAFLCFTPASAPPAPQSRNDPEFKKASNFLIDHLKRECKGGGEGEDPRLAEALCGLPEITAVDGAHSRSPRSPCIGI